MVSAVVGGYLYLTNTKVEKPTPVVVGGEGGLATDNNPVINPAVIDQSATSTENATTTFNTVPRLRHITTTPVAGADFVTLKSKLSTIWYVDRANGNIFQTAPDSNEVTRLSRTTIPKVYEAFIGRGGDNLVFRLVDDVTEKISTFVGYLKNATSTTEGDTTKELVGTFVNGELTSFNLTAARDGFLAIEKTPTGSQADLFTFPSKKTILFTHAIKKWDIQALNSGTGLVTTAPSAQAQNTAFTVNLRNGSLIPLLDARNGFVLKGSPDGIHFLFSQNINNQLVFGTYNSKTDEEKQLISPTIPDKCVWSTKNVLIVYCATPKVIPRGLYPDAWYQGRVFFSDTITAINVSTGDISTIANIESEAKESIDATNLKLSPNEDYLIFTNKRDLTLWSLKM